MLKNPVNFILKLDFVEKEQIVIIIIQQKNNKRKKNILNNIKDSNKLNLKKSKPVSHKNHFKKKMKCKFKKKSL